MFANSTCDLHSGLLWSSACCNRIQHFSRATSLRMASHGERKAPQETEGCIYSTKWSRGSCWQEYLILPVFASKSEFITVHISPLPVWIQSPFHSQLILYFIVIYSLLSVFSNHSRSHYREKLNSFCTVLHFHALQVKYRIGSKESCSLFKGWKEGTEEIQLRPTVFRHSAHPVSVIHLSRDSTRQNKTVKRGRGESTQSLLSHKKGRAVFAQLRTNCSFVPLTEHCHAGQLLPALVLLFILFFSFSRVGIKFLRWYFVFGLRYLLIFIYITALKALSATSKRHFWEHLVEDPLHFPIKITHSSMKLSRLSYSTLYWGSPTTTLISLPELTLTSHQQQSPVLQV